MNKNIVIRIIAIKIVLLVVAICVYTFCFAGCFNSYSEKEKAEMQATFQSFNNDKNFAIVGDNDELYLFNKVVKIRELYYQGNQIQMVLGLEDEYCYLYFKCEEENNNYTLHIIKLYYDTIEMEEVAVIDNVKKDVMAWRSYENEKVCFSNGDENKRYCLYDLQTGQQVWSKEKDLSWQRQKRYAFDIQDDFNGGCNKEYDYAIVITDNQTGQKKTVSWKNDLKAFEEGQYIQQFNYRFNQVPSKFICGVEKNEECYLVGWIPYEDLALNYQVVIFSYDFSSDSLQYYTSINYTGYNTPSVEIIYR